MKLLFVPLILMVQSGRAAQCNKYYGPSGVTGCVQITRYNNQYQWATCLTDAYIKQKSRHKHLCIDRSARYCWYQCMLEVHGENSGSVSKDCSCKDARYTTPNPFTGSLTTPLPPSCYSPSGDSCDWYRDCLEKKYPCEDTSNAYAIRYAEKFCRLYEKRYSLFSSNGRKWVDAVRKCLQVSLVPLLRPWYKPTCQEIRKKAFASHTTCYLSPDKDAPSVCDLSCLDFSKIFWTIKGSFFNLDTAWESLKGMRNVGRECIVTRSQIPNCFKSGKDWITNKAVKTYNRFVNIFKTVIKKFKKQIKRDRRSADPTPLPEADARSRFANGVGSAIANTLKWNTELMDWLAYTENETLPEYQDPDNLTIVILLADKKALGIVTTSAPFVNFNQTVKEFAAAIKGGKLPLKVEGFNVWVRSLSLCSDESCSDAKTLAVSDKPPNWNDASQTYKPTNWNDASQTYKPPNWNDASQTSQTNIRLLGVSTTLVMFMNKFLL